MSHPWLAEDHEDEAGPPDVRALFVRYGGDGTPSVGLRAGARSEVLGLFDLDAFTSALA